MDLEGKVAIVTGGGSGISLEFVKLLHGKNCSVVIGDLALTDKAEEFLKTASASPKVLFKKTDVTDWKQLAALFEYTEQQLGLPDVVCPGAGVFEPVWSSFWGDTEEQGYKHHQINIEHPTKLTRLAIRAFLKGRKPGIVLHISSMAGQVTRLGLPLYNSSKGYINHFVRQFELMSQENIRVMAVAPGLVNTPLWHVANPEKLKMVGESMVWLQPKDIADVMLAMCESAEYESGDVVEASLPGVTRKVVMYNDPGPAGMAAGKSTNMEVEKDVFELMQKEKGL
ncbi:NAD(P)-binding protein [Microthyrium microscopicum]|uniref:NAD(P)-binding protein n=1 Tax=Microthyrium microscopicum TaxID=703497 RepID=A0A6A6UP30_9PEZI|nr:NAD(P)-binding protein [Microthyrium microscopicum]